MSALGGWPQELDKARDRFEMMKRDGAHFRVFCPELKETLSVPAEQLNFTRGLLLQRQRPVHPSVCQLYKSSGEKQCTYESMCYQAHPDRRWLRQRQMESLGRINQYEGHFLSSSPDKTWKVVDPDTAVHLVVPRKHLRFTRGLYATDQEQGGSPPASVCMLSLRPQDPSKPSRARSGMGACTAGRLCSQVHLDPRWLAEQRHEARARRQAMPTQQYGFVARRRSGEGAVETIRTQARRLKKIGSAAWPPGAVPAAPQTPARQPQQPQQVQQEPVSHPNSPPFAPQMVTPPMPAVMPSMPMQQQQVPMLPPQMVQTPAQHQLPAPRPMQQVQHSPVHMLPWRPMQQPQMIKKHQQFPHMQLPRHPATTPPPPKKRRVTPTP
eukprot:Hpha_TRINITY_DN15743_c1_g1::TRINITY_DN15743_c1_g1_i5::g.40104::m.40104